MYETFFGLNDRPFAAAPNAKRYFQASAIENARQSLARCVEREEGIGLVIGPAGTGKTLVCQVLAEQFRARLVVALLTCGRQCTGRVMLQTILFELGLPYRGLEDGELRLSLVNHLASGEPHRSAMLLVVDEAHTLPLRLLEEVRLITNLVHNGHSRVRLILAGGPALEERLASPKLDSFNQRISARSYLQAFNYDETLAYVRYAIQCAGGSTERIFTPEALTAVHRASDGIPRLVNQLCDHALLLACAAGVSQLGPAAIEEAWSDLQQLPTPWNSAPGAAAPAADIIEFGSLEETPPAVMPRTTAKLPHLRTVPEDDETLMFDGEPAERIERIGAQLESIDSHIHAVHTFEPEVELVFASAENPFGEAFYDEEPVVDRFASMESNFLSRAQTVHNAESGELSALLSRYSRPEEPKPTGAQSASASIPADALADEAIVEPSWVEATAKPTSNPPVAQAQPVPKRPNAEPPLAAPNQPDAVDADAAESPELWGDAPTLRWADAQHAAILNPADDPVLPEPASHSADGRPERPIIPLPALREQGGVKGSSSTENTPRTAAESAANTVGNPAVQPMPANADDEDFDLIIVEDDPPPPARPQAAPVPKVRRREFSQLFAQLRRG